MFATQTRSLLHVAAVLIAALPWGTAVHAQSAVLPPGDQTPLLRLESGGPRSFVSGLAFSNDGRTLYAAGWDKAVFVWNQAAGGRFEFSPGAALRVPTGGGPFGSLNALALSPDGQWLAAGGPGYSKGLTGERDSGWVTPAGNMPLESQLQQGLIYVFNTADRTTRLLQGHRGPIQTLKFVRGGPASTPLLVSVANERNDESNDYRPVIRFWNVASGAQVAALTSFSGKASEPLPPLENFRPGIAAWSYGSSPKQTRVAIGWSDNKFRVWDVSTGQVTTTPGPQYLLAVLPLDDQGTRLFTGGHMSVGTWQLPKSGPATPGQFAAAPVASVNNKDKHLAGAAVLIPSQGTAPPRIACIVTHYLPGDRGEYRLLLLEAGRSLKLLKELPLNWKGGIRQPSLAASPDGTRLALAGSEQYHIEVHEVADLLAGRTDRAQVLSSAGVVFANAEFVQADGATGLKLSPRADAPPLVTDFKGRSVEAATARWTSAQADPQGWSIKPTAPGKLRIDGPAGKNVEIELEPGYLSTCQAVLPPTKFCPVPLAAVGSHHLGLPRLSIFRADTGEPLRWCVGHTERVNSVSFSADGRMLVSTGDDRITAVWTLTDLAANTIGQHGWITDLVIDSNNNRLRVLSAPATLRIKPGDQIIGLTLRSGESIGFETAKEFTEFVLEQKPGSTVNVSVRRNGAVQQVELPVAQAIDEVKPLFSLFVAPSASGREWQWIGWHPLGNFDTRGDDVDRWLGWQFNTGDLERPARYAAIGDYRDTFYRRDLLPSLIDAQKLVTTTVVEDPRLSIWLEDASGNVLSNQGDVLPRVNNGKLRVHAEVTGVPAKSVQAVDAFLDDVPAGRLSQSTEGLWTADLSQAAWARGRRRVSVRLKTREREVTQLVRINYSPAAPKLEWTPGWNAKDEQKSSEVTLEAKIQPADEPIEARLVIYRPGTSEPAVLKTWTTRDPVSVKEAIPIDPGESRLELEVWNASAPASDRPLESARQVAVVRRAIPEAPVIQIESVVAVSADGSEQPIEPVQLAYRSARSRFRIKGKIAATDNLTSASLELASSRRDLTSFQPGTSRQLAINELVELTPGTREVVLRSSVGDRGAEQRISLSYLPPVPTIREFKAEVAAARKLPDSIAGYLDSVYFEGYHEPSVSLTARLEGDLAHPYSLELLANDQKVDASQLQIDRTDPAGHVVTIRLPLAGGRQSFSLKATNEWSDAESLRQVDLELRRPPRIVAMELPERLAGTPLDFRAQVHSAIPLRSVRLTVDDMTEVPNLRFTQDAADPKLWTVTAEKVGLAEGEHQLQLTAANDDGLSLEPLAKSLRMDRPPVAPPVLAVTSPASRDGSLTVAQPRLDLSYRIETRAATGVRIEIHGSADNTVVNVPAAPAPEGVLVQTQPIELFEGINEITLQANNEGGFSEKSVLRVAYVPTAATVEILSVGDLKPLHRNDGTGYFDAAVPQSYLPLKGRVRLHDPAMAKRSMSARIWVNSFKLPTVPVVFDEKQPGVGTFSADVAFNRPQGNEIRVEVFSTEGRIASELGCTNALLVDCQKPDQKQELYLLLLGTGDGEEIRNTARETLQAKALTAQQASQEVWSSPTFNRIHVHDAMNVPPAAVQNRLRELIGKMHNNLRAGGQSSLNSVVMVLFQGKITLLEGDFSLATGANVGTRALTGRILEEYLTRAYGAHMILLDLTQSDKQLSEKDIWPRAPHLGILVWNWRGEGDKPVGMKLTTILGQSMPQARFVRDLSNRIQKQYQVAENEYPGLVENVDLLKDVYDLRIGGGQ